MSSFAVIDGAHGPTPKLGRVRLAKGWYPVEIGYFQGSGAATLEATVQAPSAVAAAVLDGFVFRGR